MAPQKRSQAGDLNLVAAPFTPFGPPTRSSARSDSDLDRLAHDIEQTHLHDVPVPPGDRSAPTGLAGDLSSSSDSSNEAVVRSTSKKIPPIGVKRTTPTAEYLTVAGLQPCPRSGPAGGSSQAKPQLIVLDLNGTLCVRPKRNAKGAKRAIPRPYVSALFEYLFSLDMRSAGQASPRFAVMAS